MAGNLPLGLHQQGGVPALSGGLTDILEVVGCQPLAMGCAELVEQAFQALEIARLHHHPAFLTQLIDAQCVLAGLDALRQQAVIVAEASEVRLLRSEEHTSELQSLMRTSYAVFCLKKKIK